MALLVLLVSTQVPRMAGAHIHSNGARMNVLRGVVDVTQPPYNADPTGAHDATEAINQALRDGRNSGNVSTVLLPLGVYVVLLPVVTELLHLLEVVSLL
jgi:hypothetical protein